MTNRAAARRRTNPTPVPGVNSAPADPFSAAAQLRRVKAAGGRRSHGRPFSPKGPEGKQKGPCEAAGGHGLKADSCEYAVAAHNFFGRVGDRNLYDAAHDRVSFVVKAPPPGLRPPRSILD